MATQSNFGAYVPTTQVWDVTNIYNAKLSPELEELLVRMYQNLNLMANVLNVKESGMYPLQEFATSNLWFPNPGNSSATAGAPIQRPELKMTINLPQVAGIALPAGVTAINHNIVVSGRTTFTMVRGTASDTVGFNYYDLPWASAAGATNIEIRANATQVVITNNSGIAFTHCYIVLKYLQN